jgi:hypothetical protein
MMDNVKGALLDTIVKAAWLIAAARVILATTPAVAWRHAISSSTRPLNFTVTHFPHKGRSSFSSAARRLRMIRPYWRRRSAQVSPHRQFLHGTNLCHCHLAGSSESSSSRVIFRYRVVERLTDRAHGPHDSGPMAASIASMCRAVASISSVINAMSAIWLVAPGCSGSNWLFKAMNIASKRWNCRLCNS